VNRQAFLPRAFRNGKQLTALILAPVTVAPLAWRIGMTAPVFERGLGPFLIQMSAVLE